MARLQDQSRSILFVGSSTTAGTGPTSPDKCYTELIRAARPNDVVTVTAEGGTLVSDWIGTATGAGTSLTPNYLIASNADAADISIGDYVRLYNSSGVLKQNTTFTVTSMPVASGFTNITFSPNASANTVSGDVLRRAYSLTPQNIGIVQLGINDWYVPVVSATFKSQVITMLTELRSQSPNMQIFWLRTWMPNSESASRIDQWNQYEDVLNEVVQFPGVVPAIFLDMRETNRSLYWLDDTGFHYNDLGHQLLAKKLLEYL